MWLMPSALEQTLWPVFGPRRLTVAEDEQGKGVLNMTSHLPFWPVWR